MNKIIYEQFLIEFYNNYKNKNFDNFLEELSSQTNNFENCSDELFNAMRSLTEHEIILSESKISEEDKELENLQEGIINFFRKKQYLNKAKISSNAAAVDYNGNKKDFKQLQKAANMNNKKNFDEYIKTRENLKNEKKQEKDSYRTTMQELKSKIKKAKKEQDGNAFASSVSNKYREIEKHNQAKQQYKSNVKDTKKRLVDNTSLVNEKGKLTSAKDFDNTHPTNKEDYIKSKTPILSKEGERIKKNLEIKKEKENTQNLIVKKNDKNTNESVEIQYMIYNILDKNNFKSTNSNAKTLIESLINGNVLLMNSDDIIITESMSDDLFFNQLLENNNFKTNEHNLRIIKESYNNGHIFLVEGKVKEKLKKIGKVTIAGAIRAGLGYHGSKKLVNSEIGNDLIKDEAKSKYLQDTGELADAIKSGNKDKIDIAKANVVNAKHSVSQMKNEIVSTFTAAGMPLAAKAQIHKEKKKDKKKRID